MVLPMLSSLVLFMLIFIYGQMVAQSIAQEKTSKVMELLLTSVRPLAIIIGKILAMGSLALIQFMMIVASGVLGIAVSVPLSSSIIGSSEETGAVSVAQGGKLARNINEAQLRIKLEEIQHRSSETNRIRAMWKGWREHAKKNN